jgi:hypothetical protein
MVRYERLSRKFHALKAFIGMAFKGSAVLGLQPAVARYMELSGATGMRFAYAGASGALQPLFQSSAGDIFALIFV